MIKKLLLRSLCDYNKFCCSIQREAEAKLFWITFYFQYRECVYCSDRFDVELLVVCHDKNWLTKDISDKWYEKYYTMFADFLFYLIKLKVLVGGKF